MTSAESVVYELLKLRLEYAQEHAEVGCWDKAEQMLGDALYLVGVARRVHSGESAGS